MFIVFYTVTMILVFIFFYNNILLKFLQLRNLCYMVTKREKTRRELYRAREEVFWKEYEIMTDDSCEMDEKEIQWVLALCKDNFIGNSSLPCVAETSESYDGILESFSPIVSSTADSSSTTSSAGDCSSTEQDICEARIRHQRATGGVPDKLKTRVYGNTEEVLELPSVRQTRRNSYAVNQVTSSQSSTDLIAGCSKDSDSAESSDSDVFRRKRARVKSQTSCESRGRITPKNLLHNSVAGEDTLAFGSKPRTRKRRHVSLPEVTTMTVNNDVSKEGTVPSEEDFKNADVMSRLTRSQTPWVSEKRDAGLSRGSDKPELDEKESRKENNPLRTENVIENQMTGIETTKVAGKRKRSQSARTADEDVRDKQTRITELLEGKSSNRKQMTSSKPPRLRGAKRGSEIEDSHGTKTESSVNTFKRSPSSGSFNNGRESSLCAHCKIQESKLSRSCKHQSQTVECAENWSRRELRLRSFQSPKSRARCSHVVTPKSHCCSSLMSKFCHATVT